MSKKDYYDVLGVDKGAENNDIKRAYRKLAMKYHPDRNPDDEKAAESFREVTEAYEVLADEEKRARYDQYGFAGVDDQMGGFGSGGFQGSHAYQDFGDLFGNIFGEAFGGGGGGQANNQGSDLRYNLTISLEEAALGKEVELEIPKHESCDTCSGSGARPGTNPVPCSTCAGHGQVQMQMGMGGFAVRRTCPSCQGSGKKIESPCVTCGGTGRKKVKKNLKVKIPAGVYDGAQVRVGGEGEAGLNGGTSGDLFIVVRIKEHAIFERDGADLHCEMPITFPQATLGAEVDAPTLDGKVKIRIPAGTESGRVFRLRGHGVKDVRVRQAGDLFVRVQIAVPKKLTDNQKELLQAFAKETGDEVYPERSSFLGKAKKLWDDLAS